MHEYLMNLQSAYEPHPLWKFSDTAIEIHNGITFDYYMRLPHISVVHPTPMFKMVTPPLPKQGELLFLGAARLGNHSLFSTQIAETAHSYKIQAATNLILSSICTNVTIKSG